jgi:diguanylate cyclase (GGDEF)-like protein
MRLFPEKYRVLVWISLLLTAGFFTTSIAAYMVSRDAVQRGITEQALPLASDSLLAEIQAQVMRPALIASTMANDSFVRDWLEAGEGDTDAIVRYLAGIRKQYGAVAAFLVSDRTRNYYTPQGTLKTVQENDANSSWFFRARDMKQPFLAETDIDRANGNAMTIFINHRMVDANGAFLGAAGIGLRADNLTMVIDNHEKHAGRRIYLVDGQSKVVLAGTSAAEVNRSIDQLPGLGKVAGKLLHGSDKPVLLEYEHDRANIFVSARHIPELGWHLLVEQDAAIEVRPVQNAFVLILAIGAGVSLLVLVLTLLTVNRYNTRLELMAGTDSLTGLLNRQAFEIVFHQAMLDADRSGRPLSGILFDVDFFKHVNDTYGHLAGDEVLRMISRICRTMVRESDVVSRWGGEEFVVLLKECPLEQAVAVAEKLRSEIDQHDFSKIVPDRHITISLGVAEHEIGETASVFFQRADEALYKAKTNGRNRLHVARSGGLAGSTAAVVS